jgi:hypothetical protein
VGGRAACGPVVVLSHGIGELVVRCGDLVAKQHLAPLPRPVLLLAASLPDAFVPPLAVSVLGGRPVSLWPLGVPVREADLDSPGPWASAGTLLALLHRTPVPAGLPECGAPARVRRALDRLASSPSSAGPRAKIIRDALSTARLPVDPPTTLVHGDFHLGQLVRFGGGRRLIDVDTVGVGDPAWDLARMASWYLMGIIPARAWTMFLTAYSAAGGPAAPPGADPWPRLDPYARTMTAQTAAVAVAKADLDTAEAGVAACLRMLPARENKRGEVTIPP